jgi:esterase/lipase superfamily enzyme
VAISALRELHLEISGSGRPTRDVLKLGMMAVCAPDVDFDVLVQRAITTRLGQVPEQCVCYVSPTDKAIGISNWLFGGMMRAGTLKSDVFTKEELETMRDKSTAAIVQADVSTKGTNFGHDYFHSSPAASSDLILLMRYHYRPGAQYGRPLKVEEGGGFWKIDDNYPTPTTMPASVRASGGAEASAK